jgi:hypothetical protein
VDTVRNSCDECFQEGGSSHIGLLREFDHSELGSSIDGYEEMEFALGGVHFGQIDVEEADRVALNFLRFGLSPSTSGNRLMP